MTAEATLLEVFQDICKQDLPLHDLAVQADLTFSRGELMELLEHNERGEMTDREEAVFATLADMM